MNCSTGSGRSARASLPGRIERIVPAEREAIRVAGEGAVLDGSQTDDDVIATSWSGIARTSRLARF